MATKMTSTATTKEKLERLASKQSEWKQLGLERKLHLLKRMLHKLQTNADAIKETGRRAASNECMGYNLSTAEGQCEASLQYLLFVLQVKQHLDHLIASFKVILGKDKAPKGLVASTKSNGQVAVKVFPILTSDKMGPYGSGVAEVYVDPDHVKSESDVELFALESFQKDSDKEGVVVVLGAGNQGFLTIADALQCLFVNNRVILVKHHQIREYQDDMIRLLFEPVMAAGYMDCMSDKDFDKSALYFGQKLIAGVHMTGGKATHDAIVWGKNKKERVAKKDPLLKCPMTSELGCVTPWIVSPFEYTERELESQVLAMLAAVSNNASCNCNAPKVLLVSDKWKQLPEFLRQLTHYLDSRTVPAAYYPGAKQRWEQFKEEYPTADRLGQGVDSKERQLNCPSLPWLFIRINLDLSSEVGWNDARSEYALTHEPFAPVLTIATVRGSGDKFLEMAAKLCNEVIYGSLSASMSVPQSKMDDAQVEDCVSNLRYGTIAVNAWTATGYGIVGCTWGAYPGERLDDVESGIGQLHNFWFIPHVQKSILRMPCASSANDTFKTEDFVKGSTMLMRIGDFLLNPGIGSFIRFMATQIEVSKTVIYGAGAVAAVVGTVVAKKLGVF